MIKDTPPHKEKVYCNKKKVRDSNLELYRIIVMLLIIAHHYVVNSGLFESIVELPLSASSIVMLLFGAWGKVGINCFVLITGYFMCKSKFTWDKLIKLYLQILFYTLIIYGIFCITGHEQFSILTLLWKLWPIKSVAVSFTDCFLAFYLFIPFLNILLGNLNRYNHRILVITLLLIFSILPTVTVIGIIFNYVEWFIILYIIGAYIRCYGLFDKITHSGWAWIAIGIVVLSSFSVISLFRAYKLQLIPKIYPYYFIIDCNKILGLAVAVSSFMYFKDLRIPYSRFINTVGATTFGVFLIHANSNTMRNWLWKETIDCVGNFRNEVLWTIGYATFTVCLIFVICAGIEWFRGKFIEPKLLEVVTGSLSALKKRVPTLCHVKGKN